MKLASVVLVACVALSAPVQSPKPVSLFDGRSFTGWEGDVKVFRVEQGAIVGGSLAERIPRNEFLCTARSYANFELRMKVKLVGTDANSGLQFRSARIPNNHEVSGYQADIGQGYWGSLYDESRRNKTLKGPDAETIKKIVKQGEWNDYVVRAEGPRIRLTLNGTETVDYTETDPGIAGTGVICAQIHAGPPSEAWYRDLTIVELK